MTAYPFPDLSRSHFQIRSSSNELLLLVWVFSNSVERLSRKDCRFCFMDLNPLIFVFSVFRMRCILLIHTQPTLDCVIVIIPYFSSDVKLIFQYFTKNFHIDIKKSNIFMTQISGIRPHDVILYLTIKLWKEI